MALVFKRYGIHIITGLSTQYRPVLLHCPIFCDLHACHTNIKRDYQGLKSREDDYLVYFEILEIPSNSDAECVRQAFLRLVKRFHPDSGTPEANKEKFHLIENAYRKLQNKFANERWNVNEGAGEYGLYHQEKQDENEEFDIKHKAPQHRQYLSYGGFGIGTQQQRERQFQKHRAQKAIENIHNHRISKIAHEKEDRLVLRDKQEAQKIKLRSEMDRLVEDLIQESMQRGEFDNLAGKGKPLKHQVGNPYVDFVTYKMNQVLIDNGFTPEWITLQKEISNDTRHLRDSLARYRAELGPAPLDDDENLMWTTAINKHDDMVRKLNVKIDKYNLMVPLIQKQKLHVFLKKEADKILKTGKTCQQVAKIHSNRKTAVHDENSSFFSFLNSFFTFPK